MDASGPRLPIGRSGRIDVLHLTSPDANHALLLLDAGEPSALLTARPDQGGAERPVLTAVGHPIETDADADALAAWLAAAPVTPAAEALPGWASLSGLVLLVVLGAFMVIGATVSLGWLLEAFGR
jgi:hypothetical protein